MTFGIEKRQIFCLLGPNGAGKTTSFGVMTKGLPFDTGKLVINGENLITGFCMQIDTLWSTLSIQQHLKIYAALKGLSKQQTNRAIDYLLDCFGLKDHSNKKAKEISGGMKRKLGAALAIMGDPDLLFLDEPTTGLDPVGRSQLWNLLTELTQRKGSTVVVSTHYVEDAELVADKLCNPILNFVNNYCYRYSGEWKCCDNRNNGRTQKEI